MPSTGNRTFRLRRLELFIYIDSWRNCATLRGIATIQGNLPC